MKNVLKRLFGGLIGFLFIYLLTAFYSVSFNISLWSEGSRNMCAVIGGFTFFVMAILPYNEFE